MHVYIHTYITIYPQLVVAASICSPPSTHPAPPFTPFTKSIPKFDFRAYSSSQISWYSSLFHQFYIPFSDLITLLTKHCSYGTFYNTQIEEKYPLSFYIYNTHGHFVNFSPTSLLRDLIYGAENFSIFLGLKMGFTKLFIFPSQ